MAELGVGEHARILTTPPYSTRATDDRRQLDHRTRATASATRLNAYKRGTDFHEFTGRTIMANGQWLDRAVD
ncbi:hypothetical protein GCM10027088_00080 [Nocardia goodfellowii]